MKILIVIASLIFLILVTRFLTNKKRSKTPWQQKSRPYDIFISYNTASSIKVRKIVDYLLSNGLKVWFAEYLISLDNQYNEDKFREFNASEKNRRIKKFTFSAEMSIFHIITERSSHAQWQKKLLLAKAKSSTCS
jgi:hypothetical protein